MSENFNTNKQWTLLVDDDEDSKRVYQIARALASEDRIKILRLIACQPMNIYEIAKRLNLPFSTVSNHIAVLQEAQIILVTTQQGKKRHVKMCRRQLSRLTFNLFENRATIPAPSTCHVIEMPVGHFVEANIHAPCGLYIQDEDARGGHVVANDQPCEFFTTERFRAELLWFDHGSVSYNFINKLYKQSISCLEVSFECCSEINYHRNDWPSDISVKINDIDILTLLSPGDFGGRRGKFSPEKWFINSTQYGLLYTIKIDKVGTYLNNTFISNKNISDLFICDKPYVKLSFGVSDSSIHCGGINLFGKHFGDYEQAIILKLYS